jgi:dimethylaniline monooxygenase (N-oxide forming)
MSQSSSLPSSRRVIIIGAGIYGLTAAKTYLEINPEIQLTIIDNDDSIGGVWSGSRVYTGLVADGPVPVFDLSDLEMKKEFSVPEWSDIPGSQMHKYLERYAQKFDILRRCILNTEVTHVERDGRGWKVHTKNVGDRSDDKKETLKCDVLMVATGQFSIPKFPDVDTTSFEGKVLHTRELNKFASGLSSESIQSVAVYGGNKSAFEVVTACYRAGKIVYWLIREDGAGPGLLMRASLPDGTSTSKLGFMRITSITLPQIYRQTRSWLDKFLLSGNNALGRRICDWFWKSTTLKRVGDQYEKSENMKLLKPDILR